MFLRKSAHTPAYLAPRIVLANQHDGCRAQQTDVWQTAIVLHSSTRVLTFGWLAVRRGRRQSRLSSGALSDHGDDAEDPIVITTSSSEGSDMSEMSDAETDGKAEEAGIKGRKGAGASQGNREPGSAAEGADGVQGPGGGAGEEGGKEGRKGVVGGTGEEGEETESEAEWEGEGRGSLAGPPQKKVKILEPAKGVKQKKKMVGREARVVRPGV